MPSDRDLAACFAEHRADVTALADMITQDRVPELGTDMIGDCWKFHGEWECGGLDEALARAGISRIRYETYLARLRSVGGYRVGRAADAAEISIFRTGNVASGATKGFVLARSGAPSPVVPDTDRERASGEFISFAALGDGWYVVHESN